MKNRYKKHARQKKSQNMKTHQKSDPKMEPKSIKNHSKIDPKKGTKKEGLKLYKPGINLAWRNARRPQTQSFQKTSFGVRCEESTLRKSNEG